VRERPCTSGARTDGRAAARERIDLAESTRGVRAFAHRRQPPVAERDRIEGGRVDPDAVVAAILRVARQTHPYLVEGTRLHRNEAYVEPEEFVLGP
jgi:hypothetical protein